MKIAIFLFAGFIFLFGNIDNLIGDFESDYMEKDKKMPKSKAFNKSMVMEKKTHKKNMHQTDDMMGKADSMMHKTDDMMNQADSMMHKTDNMMGKADNMMHKTDDMPAIQKTINNQRYSNNQEDMIKVINKEIEEYMDGLIPLVLVIGLFIIIISLMYVVVSSISSSSLKHKVVVLENVLSTRLKNLEEHANEEYEHLLHDIKDMNLRISSVETVSKKILNHSNNPNISEHSKKMINSNKPADRKAPIRKKANKEIATDEFMLDDDFAMDSHDEGLSLGSSKSNNKKANSKPLSDLSGLDMDINTNSSSKNNKKTNLKEMEEFSLDDFDE